METQIRELLDAIRHPETEQGIVSSGFLEEVKASPERIVAVLRFTKARDPFAAKIRQQAEKRLREAYPSATVTVLVKEGAPRKPEATERKTSTGGIGCILAVASGKGGVGKSTVTANLAVALNNLGYRVGILDADVYGPSQPKMFGLEGYVPEAEQEEGADYLLPAEARGIRIMSIGFFIKPSDALLWRGAMATNALRQMIHQTRWGELDFLLIDLPPGTGDVHLSILSELRLNGAVIVSTPQQVAVADVLRGIEMFRHSQVGFPSQASSRTWPGSPQPNCPKTVTTSSARGVHGRWPNDAAWISWAKSPSSNPSWRGETPERRAARSMHGSKKPTVRSPGKLWKT